MVAFDVKVPETFFAKQKDRPYAGFPRRFRVKKKIRKQLTFEKRKRERQKCSARKRARSASLPHRKANYELSTRIRAIAAGGIGLVQRFVQKLGLAEYIDRSVKLFKIYQPYKESDHVLNIVYNLFSGGRTLQDIEMRREDEAYLKALNVISLPDPTTAGDFCRRFNAKALQGLMMAINAVRIRIWQKQPPAFFQQTARIDADGTLIPTHGECKEGMNLAYNGVWGYHALVVSLANTGEPLFIENRPANRPSHEGVVAYYEKAIELCRQAGFQDILLRGDTDFALTGEFARWDELGVRFVFGMSAFPTLKEWAKAAPEEGYTRLERLAEKAFAQVKRRTRPQNVKRKVIRQRGYKNIRLNHEDIVDFPYQPRRAKKSYRVVALRKNLSIERGEHPLIPDIRYFFYITNDETIPAEQVVEESRQRCQQENLIEQLKNGVHALRAPVNTLNANWAYMLMCSLAWSLKAWMALSLPVTPRWQPQHLQQQQKLLRMDFRTFIHTLILIPAQVVVTGRALILRFLAWRPELPIFFRLLNST